MWAAASQQREAASASQIAPPNFEGTGVAPAVLDDDAFSGADFSDFSDLAAAAVAPAPAPEPPLRPSLENTGFMTAAVHDLKLERSSPVMTLQFEPDPEPATPSMAPAEPVLAKELCRGEYEQSAICEDLTPIRRSASPARRSRAPDSGETLGIADYVQDREPAPKPRPSTAAKGRTTSASGKPLSTSDPRARLQVAPRLRRNASFPGSDLLRQFPRWYMAIIALSLVLLAAGVVTFVLR
jgi:hypothetical protein